jgi:hypothetical protein
LNEQVKRNAARFPSDFLFQLRPAELDSLRSQIATSKKGRGGRRYVPYAFTEHGAIMAATVLNSERAIEMSIFVVRAFVRMRQAARLEGHDADIKDVMQALGQPMAPPPRNPRKIGFAPPSIAKGKLSIARSKSAS